MLSIEPSEQAGLLSTGDLELAEEVGAFVTYCLTYVSCRTTPGLSFQQYKRAEHKQGRRQSGTRRAGWWIVCTLPRVCLLRTGLGAAVGKRDVHYEHAEQKCAETCKHLLTLLALAQAR